MDAFGLLLPRYEVLLSAIPDESRMRYNIAPSAQSPIFHLSDCRAHCEMMQWGFQPHWAKKGWINARSETVFESRAFKAAARHCRCLVPATGWYEWQPGTPKQPWHFHYEDGRVFMFAGIFSNRAQSPNEDFTYAILTRSPDALCTPVHNRMPVVLTKDQLEAWVSPDTPEDVLEEILVPSDIPGLETYPVSTYVNKPENRDSQCIARMR